MFDFNGMKTNITQHQQKNFFSILRYIWKTCDLNVNIKKKKNIIILKLKDVTLLLLMFLLAYFFVHIK